MKQSQKLDALISRIIKEELNSKKKLFSNPETDELNIHYLGSDDKHDYYYDESGGFNGGTFLAQFGDGEGQHQSGFHGAYGKLLNKALKMAHDQKLLTAKDKKTLKRIELEMRNRGHIKDGDGIFTLPEEGLEEEEKEYVTPDGTSASANADQIASATRAKPGTIVKYRKAGVKPMKENEQEMQEPEMEQKPKASEIAGQVAEIMEKLKSMAEGEDPKKGKHAAKVMKYMESAKAALEALTSHETMLEEKEQKAKEDDATKQLKGVRKQLDKILKDKEMADRVMEKLSVEKMIDLKSKAKKDIDEAGLARIMVKHSLKESWVKKK